MRAQRSIRLVVPAHRMSVLEGHFENHTVRTLRIPRSNAEPNQASRNLATEPPA